MKKLILILATPFLLFSHASYANTGNNISDFAQRVASEIGQHTDYILENEDRRMLLSTTIGLYSTIFGANAVTMLPGSYTLVVSTYVALDELSKRHGRSMQALKDDAIEYLADGHKSFFFDEFSETVRKMDHAQDLTDEQIASIILYKSIIG